MPYSDDVFLGLFVFLVTRGLQELARLTGRSFAGVQTAGVAALLSLLLALLINAAVLKSPDSAAVLKLLVDFLLTWTASAGGNYVINKISSRPPVP